VTGELLSEFADADEDADRAADEPVTAGEAAGDEGQGLAVYGDAAYGSGDNLECLEGLGADSKVKPQPATAPAGRFCKEDFDIDLDAATVTCPAGATAPIAFHPDGSGTATFGAQCHGCPLRAQCTTAESGRTIRVNRHEQRLAAQRARQRGDNALPKTGSCSPTATTSPGWPSSACTKPSADGKPPPPERGSPRGDRPPPGPHGPTSGIGAGTRASTGRHRPAITARLHMARSTPAAQRRHGAAGEPALTGSW
jgi:hypothetical protein